MKFFVALKFKSTKLKLSISRSISFLLAKLISSQSDDVLRVNTLVVLNESFKAFGLGDFAVLYLSDRSNQDVRDEQVILFFDSEEDTGDQSLRVLKQSFANL